MKKSILSLSVALFSVFLVCSCLNDDETVLSTDCYISSFTLGNVKRQVTTVTSEGNDTTYSVTYSASYYPMTVNQLAGTIFNEDSLPLNSDVSAVLATVESSGTVIYRDAEDTEENWQSYSTSDSIDFTSTLVFRVYSPDYSAWRDYTVNVNVHQQDGEIFTWEQMAEEQLWEAADTMKAVVWQDNIWLFCRTDGAVTVFTTSLADGTQWAEQAVTGCGEADVSTLAVFGDRLYMTTPDGALISSADGSTWESVAADRAVHLLAADSTCLYALSDGVLWRSADGELWLEEGLESDPSFLPVQDLTSVSYVQENGLYRILLAGNRSLLDFPEDNAAMLWSRSTVEAGGTAPWTYFNVSPDNSYACPQLKFLHIMRYDEVLLALGGASLDGVSHNALDNLYVSSDNGVTWKEDGVYVLPESVEDAEGALAAVVDADNYLWLVVGGQVWRGRLNELGFTRR